MRAVGFARFLRHLHDTDFYLSYRCPWCLLDLTSYQLLQNGLKMSPQPILLAMSVSILEQNCSAKIDR